MGDSAYFFLTGGKFFHIKKIVQLAHIFGKNIVIMGSGGIGKIILLGQNTGKF